MTLVINNWHKGIAQSPFLGFEDIRNADISSVYGVLRPSFSMSKDTGSTITGSAEVSNMVYDPVNGDYYAVVGSTGTIYKLSSGTWSALTTTGYTSSGNKFTIIVWKNYLVSLRDNASDSVEAQFYGPLNSSPSWSATKLTFSSASTSPTTPYIVAVHGQDDILYFGHNKYVHGLKENFGTTFAPATSSTYTKFEKAVTLPDRVRVNTLTELNTQLLIGGISYSINGAVTDDASIFPWDRTSPTFSMPIKIRDFGVKSSITVGNTNYFFTGSKGTLWATNGSGAKYIGRLPQKLFGFDSTPNGSVTIFPNAICQKGEKILFGVGGIGAYTSYPVGVWSYNTQTGAWNHEYKISPSATPTIGCLLHTTGSVVYAGWSDGSSAGVDKTSSSAVYTSYGTSAVSKTYFVGTFDRPAEFSSLHVILGKDLASGDGVRISYRTSRDSAFTVLYDESGNVFDYATYGARNCFGIPIKITARLLQIKCEITTSGTSIPELLDVRLQ